MQDGIYNITLKSPLGAKMGSAEINSGEGRMKLRLLGEDNVFYGEFVPEYAFQMTGSLKTALDNLHASLKGSISEGRLLAVMHTENGDFPVEGVLNEEK